MGWFDALGATAQAGLNMASFGYNIFAAERARRDYQKYRSEDQAREDNAIQRRVEDMRAAGINPVLAAGQAAQASTSTHNEPNPVDAPNILSLIQAKESIQNTRAERKRIQAETSQVWQNIQESKSRIKLQGSQAGYARAGTMLSQQQHAYNEIANPITIEAKNLRNTIDQEIHNLETSRRQTENNMLSRKNEIGEQFDRHMAALEYSQQASRDQILNFQALMLEMQEALMRFHSIEREAAVTLSQNLVNQIMEHNLGYAKDKSLPVGSAVQGLVGQMTYLIDMLFSRPGVPSWETFR